MIIGVVSLCITQNNEKRELLTLGPGSSFGDVCVLGHQVMDVGVIAKSEDVRCGVVSIKFAYRIVAFPILFYIYVSFSFSQIPLFPASFMKNWLKLLLYIYAMGYQNKHDHFYLIFVGKTGWAEENQRMIYHLSRMLPLPLLLRLLLKHNGRSISHFFAKEKNY